MKNTRNLPARPTLRGLVLALAVTALSSYIAQAHPYASGITNVGGTISFILNEAADTVGVYFPDNNSTNFLGNNLAAGVHSFTLGAGTNAYVITVHKTGAGGPVQISVDTSNAVLFPAPRGVAVNANPKDRHFGLIYAANSSPGNTGHVGRVWPRHYRSRAGVFEHLVQQPISNWDWAGQHCICRRFLDRCGNGMGI